MHRRHCRIDRSRLGNTFRPDDDTARALAVLTRDGTWVSEAEALTADERDRTEVAQVLRDMETLRAW